MLGVLLIDKPRGITSHDVVNAVRRRFHTKRVGHAGTLDPLATGLLVVAVGPATRFLQYLPLEPKEYVGTIRFGSATDSYDAEGETVREAPVPEDLAARIEAALPRFLGLIEQLPPLHSAVKVRGKPMYRYARAGQEVERTPRRVHIETFEVLGIDGADVRVRVVCSGGTYVRSLAHDLGEAVGSAAHLAALVRTRVGKFLLEGATALDAAGPDDLLTLAQALPPMPLATLNETQVRMVREGQAVQREGFAGHRHVALLAPGGDVVGVARVGGIMLQPECVIPAPVHHEPDDTD